ncbi:MAG: hypothetical protein HY332_04670 [Chloroflexi bacterium]|nr:hypothetical protein [Chloroflexota bacterium]
MKGPLDVYVAAHCRGCAEARRLAAAAAARFPEIAVRIVDLDGVGDHKRPNGDKGAPREPIVAIPAYVLDGRVISLGNPAPEGLFAELEVQLEVEQ